MKTALSAHILTEAHSKLLKIPFCASDLYENVQYPGGAFMSKVTVPTKVYF